ncbi:MAG: alpha/beta hydrolase [Planctomycetes bacterium]|nr:alpha/beta hydrolase [Planctomycetota bacterium]
MVSPLYEKLLAFAEHGVADLTVMGDSSGGDMVQALAQKAVIPQPKELVLPLIWHSACITF